MMTLNHRQLQSDYGIAMQKHLPMHVLHPKIPHQLCEYEIFTEKCQESKSMNKPPFNRFFSSISVKGSIGSITKSYKIYGNIAINFQKKKWKTKLCIYSFMKKKFMRNVQSSRKKIPQLVLKNENDQINIYCCLFQYGAC